MIRRFISQVIKSSATLSALILLLMAASIVSDVIARPLFQSIPGTFELNEVLLVIVVFLVLAGAQIERRHVNVSLFISRFSPRRQTLLKLFVLFLSLSFFCFFTLAAGVQAYSSTIVGEQRYGLIPFPVWPARIFLCLGLFLLCLQLSLDIVDKLKDLKTKTR